MRRGYKHEKTGILIECVLISFILMIILGNSIAEDDQKKPVEPGEKEMSQPIAKTDQMDAYYGCYQITQFCPTIYYGNVKYDCLPEQEADLMLGQEVVITEERFNTYDNKRSPNSGITDRLEDGFWIERVEIATPEYRVESRFRKDIYGLRDDMLPEELGQQEYIEINVYPGYERMLPQLFLTENGKIMMYAMGEYFLLERKSETFSISHSKEP